MKKLLLSALALLIVSPAFAADLPVKARTAAAVPILTAPSPFFVGIYGGGGASSTENVLTLDGVATGPVKAYPTGVLAGGTFGARWNTGTLAFTLAEEVGYDFSKGGVGCNNVNGLVTGGQCAGSLKNGLLIQEVAKLGVNVGTMTGQVNSLVPTVAQPQNWLVPINVPTSALSNLEIDARGGLAHRWITLCAQTMVDAAGDIANQCGSQIVTGGFVGGELSAAISANSRLGVALDHVFWRSTFTPTSASALFNNAVAAKDETIGKVFWTYNF